MNDLPEFTYTVENELDDEPAFTGTLKVYSPNARNDAAGTYEIEVDLSGVSYTVNYKPGDPPYINGTLTVASTDATLSGLTISEGELPDFSPLTMEYNVTVPGSIRSLTVTPTASDHNAEISVNGTEVKSGMPSGEIPLNVGPNTITIEVTSQDGKAKETYTVNVYVLANFSGSGDSEEDPYLIQTAEDLKDMAYLINEGIEPYANVGKHYKLANDIDLSAFANDDNDKGWTPIGTYEKPFKGIFDGNGKSITGLKIDRPGESDIGLFGYVSGGTIKNLQVTAEVEGRLTVGGIVGRLNNYGLVQNCFINGSVTGMQGVGGIAGEITGTSKILNSGSNVNVLGLNHVGGIVGNINSSSGVQNCYSAGSVTADREDPYLLAYPNHYVGGIAGWLQDLYGNSFVRNCYSIAEIVGDNMVGGIVGRGERSRIEDCFALNPSVSSEGSVERVLGYNNYASCFNLYAFAGMKVIGQSITGAGETAININQISDSSFWTTSDKWYGSVWDENVWVFENNKLPMLKNVPGQSEDALRWDISELDIDITGSYIYTGDKNRCPVQG